MTGILLVSYVLLWFVVVGLVLLVIGTLKQLGELQLTFGGRPSALITDDGLAIGEPAPNIPGLSYTPEVAATDFPPPKRNSAILFMTTTCSPCQKLVPAVNEFWSKERSSIPIYVVCKGTRDEVDEFARQFSAEFTLNADADGAIARRFGHERTPFAYLIDEHGIVRMKGVINDRITLNALVEGRGTSRSEAAWKPAAASPVDGEPVIGRSQGAS